MKTADLLTDEQLIAAYQTGDRGCIEILVQRYKPFVRKKIKANYFVGADVEDLIQEGMVGLFKAICDYNPHKDATFKSFATLCIIRQISTAFKTATRQKHMPLNTSISLNLPVAGEEDDGITLMDTLKDTISHNPEEMIIHQEDLKLLKQHMKESLSEFEWEVLNAHTQGQNYHEIAEHMGKSVKSIDNALQRIKRKLSEVFH
ncbi:MAG: RNA polymerase sporulation sigma factor SigH [Niameybacter sp.]|uniref:RNA polymerase sporulation sigma factor SigH n=1 Tax=Niameybacter sp. TaxID=2033640 RepID=UPI002FC9E0EA